MNQTKEGLSEVLKENWHAIEGANGMCACGTEKGNCNTRLLEAFQEAEQRGYEKGKSEGKDLASDFLYLNPLGGGFPNDNITIGVAFEVGGKYEDWGFVIRMGDKRLSEGRTLKEAIEKVRKS